MPSLMAALLDTGPIRRKFGCRRAYSLLLAGSRGESVSRKATCEELSLCVSHLLFSLAFLTREGGLYR